MTTRPDLPGGATKGWTMNKKTRQRVGIFLIAMFAFTGIGGAATAAPAEAYQVTSIRYISHGPYLAGTWECYVNFGAWEEWVLRKRDGWYPCGQYL